MSPRPWSLRRRLLVTVGVAILVSWLASSTWVYLAAVRESERLLDDALDHTGHAILTVMRAEAAELREQGRGADSELPEMDQASRNDIVYQLLGPNGRPIFRSHGAPVAMLAGWHDRGFATRDVEGKPYRVLTLTTELDALTIHIAQPLDRRREAERDAALRQIAPGAALMLVLIVAVAWTIRGAADPVIRYAEALDRLPPDADMPVDGSRLPQELKPVVRAIDDLLARIRSTLLRERTLTADAAHELRTPLAALRLQAQVARRSRVSSEREAALDDLVAGVDRAARMVDTILTLARFDGTSRATLALGRVALDRLAQIVAAEYAPMTKAAGIQVRVDAQAAQVPGDEDALAVALRNLLGNACRFARSRIDIQVETTGSGTFLRVLDDGPGFDAQSATRAFQRFFRGGQQGRGADGTGLGLALVLRIAQLHGGTARLVPGLGGGAGVEIELPRSRFEPAT